MRILVVGAILVIVTIVLGYLLVAQQFPQLSSSTPGVLVIGAIGSILAALIGYIFYQPLHNWLERRLARSYISEESESYLTGSRHLCLYEGWYAVPWEDLFLGSTKVEFFVSFLDSWVNQRSHILGKVFDRGGEVRVFLPKIRVSKSGQVSHPR